MQQYTQLLQDILSRGTWKEPARPGMPETVSLFGTRIEHNMFNGFPLLTTKKMSWENVAHELIWFLKGDTNIKYLVDNKCNIWNKDAYKWYCKYHKEYCSNSEPIFTIEQFIDYIKRGLDIGIVDKTGRRVYKIGGLGKVYGYQWRNQNGVDQVKTCLQRLKEDPMGRYAIIDAWNPSDFDEMALPPCHLLYQFNCREINPQQRVKLLWQSAAPDFVKEGELVDEANVPRYYLDLQMYQRSCDTFLGVPFNIASMAMLLLVFCEELGYIPGRIIWVGGDTHIYKNHITQVQEQLGRKPLPLPSFRIKNFPGFDKLTIDNFELSDYKSHPRISGELSVGV